MSKVFKFEVVVSLADGVVLGDLIVPSTDENKWLTITSDEIKEDGTKSINDLGLISSIEKVW